MILPKHVLCALMAAAGLIFGGAGAAQAAYDPPHNVAPHPGPQVWKEEYWDVPADKVQDFIAAYRTAVYPTARTLPGYRGYTVMSFQSPPGQRVTTGAPENLAKAKLIHGHAGITLEGVLTERSVDVGTLIARTHSVVIAHSFQTWADAERFNAAFGAAYAKTHNGEDGWSHFAKTLFPMASNYWETYFRLVSTGYPGADQPRGGDANGLNLEPRNDTSFWIKEYWDVPPERFDAFLKDYVRDSYPVLQKAGGDYGMTVLAAFPSPPGGPGAAAQKAFTVGGSARFYEAHPGVMMDGTIPTNTSVNFGALFKPAFTAIIYHHMTANAQPLFFGPLQDIYAKEHPGQDWVKTMEKSLFAKANNHWDMTYHVTESSFAPVP